MDTKQETRVNEFQAEMLDVWSLVSRKWKNAWLNSEPSPLEANVVKVFQANSMSDVNQARDYFADNGGETDSVLRFAHLFEDERGLKIAVTEVTR